LVSLARRQLAFAVLGRDPLGAAARARAVALFLQLPDDVLHDRPRGLRFRPVKR
jgi:hypothetical protein